MTNIYTYFMKDLNNINYATFGPSNSITDPYTNNTYTNLFDAAMDGLYSAMEALGYSDIYIAVGETGWPSVCEEGYCTPQNAANYNLNVIKRGDVVGTPLMPNRHVDIFLFALFNENEKPGPITEQNWGLFKPDFSPVYDCGVLRDGPGLAPALAPSGGGEWCVAKEEATDEQLQSNIDWVCSQGIDCKPISPGGICYDNNNLRTRSSFIMNFYYQTNGKSDDACNFSGSGIVITIDPSSGTCVIPNGG